MLDWRQLDERALAYARSELENGKSLARECLAVLETFAPWALLPADWSNERAHNFESGGGAPHLPREQLLPTERLWGHLEAPRSVLVFEDPYLTATERSIANGDRGINRGFLGDEVYELLDAGDSGDASKLPVGEWPIIGVPSKTAGDPPANGALLDSAFLARLTTNAVAVLVGAWDAESYVVLDRGLLAG